MSHLAATALAHPEGFSGLQVNVSADRIQVALTLHTRDMGTWFPPGSYPDYVADVSRELEQMASEIVELQIDGQTLEQKSSRAFLVEVGLIELDVEYALPSSDEPFELLVWSKHLIYLPRGHQQLLFILDNRASSGNSANGIVRLEDVLTSERDAGVVLMPNQHRPSTSDTQLSVIPAARAQAGSRDVDSPPGPEENAAQRKPKNRQPHDQTPRRISFFVLGIEHILTGYDHLLFLLALLLASNSFKQAAAIISCFTLAHSITLALAALGFVRLSPAIVEPVIALSIVYVALENLYTVPRLQHRMAVTCGFGLVHGLGFATVLRDVGLGDLPGGMLPPLLTFNLGIEAGQLSLSALVFPCLLWARRSEPGKARLLWCGSILIALLGCVWMMRGLVTLITAM